MSGSSYCILRTFAFIFILFTNQFILCSFSPEELKAVSYEVDILQTPVKLGEEQILPVLFMTSKYGQQYQCILPHLEEKEELSEKKDSTSEENSDIKELLKPLKNGPCLLKAKDWWTYELCFGHYIKQYHIEDGKILGEVITLGIYDSEFDWSNETAKEKFVNSKQRYHSQTYTNGTKCDLTGMPRNAEVRFLCEKDAGDYVYRVDEPGTCSYILTVHTSTICAHPLLKPPLSNKAHSIACSPLLNEEQYSKYLKKINEEKQMAEEKRNQWLSDQQERLKVMKNWAKENFLHLDEGEEMEKVGQIITADENTQDSLPIVQQIKDNQMESKDEEEMESSDIYKDPKKMETTDTQEEKVLDEEGKVLFQEYIKEIEKLKVTSSPKSFAAVKEGIQKTYDSIISEAEEDLDQDLSDEAKDAVFSKLASTLNMLLEKLDKAEKDVARATKELEKAKSVISTKKGEGANEEDMLDEDDEDDATDDDVLDNQESKNNNNVKLKVIEDGQTQSAVLDDDKVHVRIRRLDRKALDPSGKLHEMDFAQRRKLEQAVKEKLEKAGLDTGGRRIEVKIITAGYYDNEDGKDFHALSDEETSQFQSMIMALLTGQQEAVQEMERHKKLEENYKLVWEFGETKSEEDE